LVALLLKVKDMLKHMTTLKRTINEHITVKGNVGLEWKNCNETKIS
jgi:hypothetical protein